MLFRSDLSKASLRHADLRGAKLDRTRLIETDLGDAKSTAADLERAELVA